MKPNKETYSHKPVPHGGLYSISNPKSDVIDYSSNINPFGPPPRVFKIIKKNLNTTSVYPDPDSIEVRKALQKYTKIPYTQIVVGNGATEIIYNFCKSFLSHKTHVLIPIPTFGEYEVAAKLAGAKVEFFKTMDLKNDLDKFISKIPNSGCIFVCNPNNPVGYQVTKNDLKKLVMEAKKKNTLVFLDESFIELVPSNSESFIGFIKKFENLFILRSLTKSFGLAGLRIGYALGSKKIISILNKIKIPWNVSGLAQLATIAAISTPHYLENSKKLIELESIYLKENISKLNNFNCYDSKANFILIKTKIQSTLLQKKLLEKKILVRDCKSIRGLNKNFIRISVKKRKDNQKLVRTLRSI